MPGGRPRKPDELHILEGTWRDDRNGDPSSAISADGEAAPPAHLDGEALRFWQQVVPGLIKSGLARERDAHELAMMCEWWSRYRRLSRVFDKAPNTKKNLHSLLVQVAIASDKFDRIAMRFGLTPSDRAKLRVADKPKAGGVMSRKRGG